MKPEILQLVPVSKHIQEQIDSGFSNHQSFYTLPTSKEILNKIEAIITNGVIGAPSAMLDALPNLRLVTVHGVGYDNVDVEKLKSRNIRLSIAKGAPTQDVANMAIALLLDITRQIMQRDQFIRNGEWEKGNYPYQGSSISNKKIGIMGMGDIGKAIAQRMYAFDNEILYTARHHHEEVKWTYIPSLLELATQSDVLIIAASGGPQTRHAVNMEVLEAIGERGFVINIGRGSIIDEQALIHCLQNKKIAGAGLDVFEHEPYVPKILNTMPNIVMTPHSAGATYETSKRIGEKILNSLNCFFGNESLPDEVKL